MAICVEFLIEVTVGALSLVPVRIQDTWARLSRSHQDLYVSSPGLVGMLFCLLASTPCSPWLSHPNEKIMFLWCSLLLQLTGARLAVSCEIMVGGNSKSLLVATKC